MVKSDGPTPAIGEMMPPRTWYTPWYWPVFSMLITSLTFSTTQMVLWSRLLSEQIEQVSSSEIILQIRQYFASSLSLTIESAK